MMLKRRGSARCVDGLMKRRFLGFTFEREARWLMVLCLVIPVLLALIAIVIPRLWRFLGQGTSLGRG